MTIPLLSRIIPFLSKAIPTGLAIKGLGKIDPKIESFLGGAFGAGYTADQAMDFLREHFENPEKTATRQRYEKDNLRPDELASKKRIGQAEAIPNALQTALTGGAALAGGLGALSNVRGQQKKSEGGLLGGASAAQQPNQPSPMPQSPSGLSKKEVINQFLENFPEEGKASAKPGQAAKIAHDFPQLLQFIQKKISEGNDLTKASELAHKSKLHGPIARKVEADTGLSLPEWAQEQLGGGQSQQGNQSQGKDQFLAGLNQLAQKLQGFKRQ